MSIANNCMVLNLHIGIWIGQRLDKAATQALTIGAGAEDDAARVNKHLISKEALKPVTSVASAIRTHFYTRTLPWKDNGDRVISRKAFTTFIEEHERLVGEFHKEVEEFCTNVYDVELDRASFRMGDLFKPDDYPSASAIRHKFHASMDIDPVAQASDFRVEIDEKHVARVREQIEKATRDRVGRAMASVWEKLVTLLENYITRTKAGTGIRVELVDNLREVVAILPELNITDDPHLEAVRIMIERRLIGHDAADLRKDDAARAQATKDAEKIMAKMRGFMVGSGVEG